MAGAMRIGWLAALAVAVATPGAGQAPAFRSPAATPVAAAPALSVMTFNIKGLPWPLASGRPEALARIADRLALLREEGRQPHVVLLQEAFVPEADAIAARAGYPYAAAGPTPALRTRVAATPGDVAYLNGAFWTRGEQVSKPLGSGLLILSDYPITATARLAFPDFACAGFDCLANKGALLARIAVPDGGAVSVVNTHLNARRAAGVPFARSLRAFDRQAALVAGFVRAAVPPREPLVIGGDLNIGGDRDRRRAFFGRFEQAGLGFVREDLGGVRRLLASAVLDGRARRDLHAADRRGKDWLFARAAGNAPLAVAGGGAPFGVEADGTALSDHVGYQVDYAPPERSGAARLP